MRGDALPGKPSARSRARESAAGSRLWVEPAAQFSGSRGSGGAGGHSFRSGAPAASSGRRPHERRQPGGATLPVLLGVLTLATVVAATWIVIRHHARALPRAAAATVTAPAAEAGIPPWQLGAPVSRAVTLPGPGKSILIFGGLTVGGESAGGVYSLNPSSGRLRYIGNLASPLHDSAGGLLEGRYFIFGGRGAKSTSTVERFAASAPIGGASVVGRLPKPRSGGAVVVLGGIAYILGGYDGRTIDPTVLATSDGSTFRQVAVLPVPVRYPAAAAAGGKIFLFGGLGANGPVDSIQMVDPATGRAAIVGRLHSPLYAASAATTGKIIYLAGGEVPAGRGGTPHGSERISPVRATGGAPPSTGEAGSTQASPTGAIWAFQPETGKLFQAGSLAVPIAHSASVLLGDRIWLVGGETGNQPVATVQMITPNAAFGLAGEAGAGQRAPAAGS